MPAPKGSLVLDTKEGLLKGGVHGPALVPGKPAESRLLNGPELQRSAGADAAQRQAAGRGPGRLRAVDCAWRGRPSRQMLPHLPRRPPNTRACRSKTGASGGHSNRSPYTPASRRSGGAAKADNKIDYFVLAKLAAEEIANVSAGRSAHARHARLRRSARLQADLRRSPGVRQRPVAECLREADRSSAGVAALRRAMGAALDGRRALRRRQPDVGSDQPAVSVRLAVSRLDHRSAQRGHALRPLRQAAAGRRLDAEGHARRHAGARIRGRRADLSPRPASLGRGDRQLPDRRLGRAHRRRVARRARRDDGVRALPRSQVRSDLAEGLLRADGRVRLDDARRAPDVPGRSEDRTAIHVAAAPAVRPGVFGQPARQRGHHVHGRRREGGEVESRDREPQGGGDQPC